VALNLRIGPLRVTDRPPSVLSRGAKDVAVIQAGQLGFSGAAEADQARWLHAFRRLLDGLDSPLQVLVESRPGSGGLVANAPATPHDFDEMRFADMAFVEQLDSSTDAHKLCTSLICGRPQAVRVESVLREMGIPFATHPAKAELAFGQEDSRRLRTARGWSRTWCVARLPGIELDPGWWFRLIPPGLNIRLSCHAIPIPTAWVTEYLQRQLTNMRASHMRDLGAGASDPQLAGALPNVEDLQRRITASQDKAFHVSIYLTLTATSSAGLDEGSAEVSAAARAILCELQPCTFRMADAYLATLPAGEDPLMRSRILDTSTLATLFPWSDVELRQAGGMVVGRSAATGAPVLIDPFDQLRFANANIGVFGYSGAGKTYLLSTLAMGALGRGTQVYVIDPEHEYGRLARNLGGVDIQLALGSGHALNVLDLRTADRRDEAWLGPATADAVDLCGVICGGLDESERATVELAVRTAYVESDQPVLGDVARAMPEGSRAATVLGRWVSGSLGQMFSAPTNIDLDAPIVVFGMRELRDEMVAPVHFLLAEALWARIKRRERRRMLIVDELGLLFEDPTIRRFVVGLARRIRKYDGSLVFATQNPGDLLSSESGAVVATNPATLFLGAQRPGEAAKLQQAFQLSEQQRSFLEAARRGDFLLAAALERLSIHVQAPPWQEAAMRRARDAARPPPSR
jgi:conjugal transfer ATP-binding protein TraC